MWKRLKQRAGSIRANASAGANRKKIDFSEINSGSREILQKMIAALKVYLLDKKYNLSQRAPCFSDILSDMHTLLMKIFTENSVKDLKANQYFPNFLRAFRILIIKAIRLFMDCGDMLVEPTSAARESLLKLTLSCNHHNNELHAMYNSDFGKWQSYEGMQQTDARDFWMRKFAPATTVSTTVFLERFREEFEFTCETEVKAFHKSVDLCDDEMVSWWEFDIFARLYEPWDRILNTWNVIVTKHPGYRAWSTYDQVKNALQPFTSKPGSYVFRLSVTRPGQWAIGFVHPGGRILQAIPEGKSLYQALIDGSLDGTYIYPEGQDENVDLRKFMPVSAADHIQVSFEQNAIYAKVDSTFELCKICHSNNKNYRIEPCGHLMCQNCFDEWTVAQGAGNCTCPFCRGPITSSIIVVVDPYKVDGGGGDSSAAEDGGGGGGAAAAAGGGGGGAASAAIAPAAASGPAAAAAQRREVNNRTFSELRDGLNSGLTLQEQRIMRRNEADEQTALDWASRNEGAQAPPVPARRMSLGSSQLEDMRIFAANTSVLSAVPAATERRSTSVDASALLSQPLAGPTIVRRGSFSMGMLRSSSAGSHDEDGEAIHSVFGAGGIGGSHSHGAAHGDTHHGAEANPYAASSVSSNSDGSSSEDDHMAPSAYPRSVPPLNPLRPRSANGFGGELSGALSPIQSSTSDEIEAPLNIAGILAGELRAAQAQARGEQLLHGMLAQAPASPPLSWREQELEAMFESTDGNFERDDAAIQMMTRSELIDTIKAQRETLYRKSTAVTNGGGGAGAGAASALPAVDPMSQLGQLFVSIGTQISDSSELDTIINTFDLMSDLMHSDDQPGDRGGPMARTEAFSQSVSDLAELTFNRVLQAESAIEKAEARGNLISSALCEISDAEITPDDFAGRITQSERAVDGIGEISYGSGSGSDDDDDDDNADNDDDDDNEGSSDSDEGDGDIGGRDSDDGDGHVSREHLSDGSMAIAAIAEPRVSADLTGSAGEGEEAEEAGAAPWLHGTVVGKAESETLLKGGDGGVLTPSNNGRFLIRKRVNETNQFIMSLVFKGNITHHLIKPDEDGNLTVNDKVYCGGVSSIVALVNALVRTPMLTPKGSPVELTEYIDATNNEAVALGVSSSGGSSDGAGMDAGDGAESSTAAEMRRASSAVYNEVLLGSAASDRPPCPDEAPPPRPPSPTSAPPGPPALDAGESSIAVLGSSAANRQRVQHPPPVLQLSGEGIYGDVDNAYIPGPTRTGAPASFTAFNPSSDTSSDDDEPLPAAPRAVGLADGLHRNLQHNLQHNPTPPTPTFAAPTASFDELAPGARGGLPPPPAPRSAAQNPVVLLEHRRRMQDVRQPASASSAATAPMEPDYHSTGAVSSDGRVSSDLLTFTDM